jgi:hypothetical protein
MRKKTKRKKNLLKNRSLSLLKMKKKLKIKNILKRMLKKRKKLKMNLKRKLLPLRSKINILKMLYLLILVFLLKNLE